MKQNKRAQQIVQTICFQCMRIRKNDIVCDHCGYDFRHFKSHSQYLDPGSILKDKYLLGVPLGSDGFNNTYMAFDMTINRRMVVKEYFPVGLTSRGVDLIYVRPNADEAQNELFVFGKRAFLKEAMTLSDIRMQHVLQVDNYFSENNTAYMVQDFLDGTDLARHLMIKGGRLSIHEAVDIVLPILNTLHRLHKKNVFHYNLTLSKIMIVPQGFPVIFGFGQAKQMLDKQSESIKQTIQYSEAPPEQFQANGKIGAWSDVYSCGIILYRILTGIVPPNAQDRLKKDQWISASQVPSANISPDLSDVVDHAVTLDTHNRYKSAREFIKGIKSKMPKQKAHNRNPLTLLILLLILVLGYFGYHWFYVERKKSIVKQPTVIQSVRPLVSQALESDHKVITKTIKPQPQAAKSSSSQAKSSSSQPQDISQTMPSSEKETLSNILFRICGDQELIYRLGLPLVKGFLETLDAESISKQTDESGNIYLTAQGEPETCQVSIDPTGSDHAYEWLQYGRCDMVLTGQQIQIANLPKPLTNTQETDFCPTKFLIATDGIVVMVHPDNRDRSMSIRKIQDIFTGQITQWDNNQSIHIYTPKTASDLYQLFKNQFLSGKDIKATRQFQDLEALSKHLNKDPQGIGLCSLPFVYDNNALAIADYEIDPVRPSYFSVAIDSYPMIRKIYLYTILISAAESTLPFINFVQSKKGQAIVKEWGYVDCTVKALGARRELWQKPVNKAVFEKVVDITRPAHKLSMNFYFENNQYELTEESGQKLKQLVLWLKRKSGMFKIYVIGYSDSRGAYRHNCLVALKRAETVSREMKMSGVYVDDIVTACEEFPIASNQTEMGRFKNRRVEIWIQTLRMH